LSTYQEAILKKTNSGSISLAVILSSLMILMLAASAFGCVGARPLAMGGAFIGLADDANATYWNPAGLAQLEKTKATLMYTSNNRDAINYQDYEAIVQPVTPDLVLGFSHIGSRALMEDGVDDQDWFWLSGGFKMKTTPVSFGVNLRKIDNSYPGLDTETGIDISFFYKVDDRISVGLLVQDFNKPVLEYRGYPVTEYIRNIRPGVAFRPTKDSVLTMDIYDLLDDGDAQPLRVGYEKRLESGLALRAGYYNLGDDSNGGLTFGAGMEFSNIQADLAVMSGDMDNTLFLSATTTF
jgi:hypothetical protein